MWSQLAYFHVPIHPNQRKYFSSHLALPLLVKEKFIELQSEGYFVCSRPDLAPLVSSAQTPQDLRHLYHQVVEFSHVALLFGWTSLQSFVRYSRNADYSMYPTFLPSSCDLGLPFDWIH